MNGTSSRSHRVVATFAEPPEAVAIPGLLSEQGSGRQRALIVSDFSSEKLDKLRAVGAVQLEVQDCSLEDIFVAHVRPQRKVAAAVEGEQR